MHYTFEKWGDFPAGPVVKNLPANAGDADSILGPGRYHMPRYQGDANEAWPHYLPGIS